MSIIDGIFAVLILLIIAAILALAYERQNGYINHKPPEPTVFRQLEACGHQLATAQQSLEVWMDVARKYKATAEELAKALENCNNG